MIITRNYMTISIDEHCPSSLKCYFKVLVDEEEVYACTLNIADVVNNCNKSYIMQLVQRQNETYVIYSRFGRVGQIGTMSTDVFIDKDLAVNEFKRIFYDKTGVHWSNRYTDTSIHTGKYQFILMKHDNVKTHNCIDEKETITIDAGVVEFIKTIHDPSLYNGVASGYELDIRKLPLGSLGLAQIQRASDIIAMINKLIDVNGNIKKGKNKEVTDLSSLFYTTIPTAQAKIKPIDTPSALAQKGDLLDMLRNMCYMSKSVNKTVMQQYYKLETNLVHVTDRETYQMIMRYLNTNMGSTHKISLNIVNIYEIDKPKERQAYRKWNGLHNKQLLWHGTRMANAVGILTTGMRINPVGVPTTGKMFGNGLYFANASTKSAGYMGLTQRGVGMMFLCEVALGNMYERYQSEHVTKLPDGKHSTKGVGISQPNTDTHVMIGDVTVPIGKLESSSTSTSGKSLQYDEFIVYDTSQIKMKYAVVVDYQPKW